MSAQRRALRAWPQWGGALLVALVGLVAYWPTLGFNFFWEDPFDIGQVEPFSYLQVLSVANSNSYYRPLALVILKALKFGGSTYQPAPYHLFVVAGHVLSGVLLFGLASYLFVAARPFGSGRPERSHLFPLAAGLLYALYPLPYEATARASSMHEWLTAAMFASFWLYAWGRVHGRRWPLLAALLLMALAQTLHENGLLFPALVLVLELWLVWQRRVERWSRIALVYALPALVFFGLWLAVPKAGEPPQVGLHLREALYLSQAISFPIAGPIAWLGGFGLSPEAQAGLALPLALGVLLVAHGRARARRLALALAWWGLAISLAWLARPIEYLQVSPRVMYFPAFGAALAWAGVVDFGRGWLRPARLRRAAAALLLAILLAQSSYVLARFTALYRSGSDLMGAVITAGAAGGRVLYVNVPDRFEHHRPPYPLGYWGMLLAPVSQSLSDFVEFSTGVPVETDSLSDFQLLAAELAHAPYRVNARGVDAFASALLYETALWSDRTYVTRYESDGRMWLTEVGAIDGGAPSSPQLAAFERVAGLQRASAQLLPGGDVRVELVWRALGHARPNDTVFIHLLGLDGALAAQADGDTLGGLLPPSAWRAGDEIRDVRLISPTETLPPGEYTVAVGLYSRVDGSRYSAVDGDGAPITGGAAHVATVMTSGGDS